MNPYLYFPFYILIMTLLNCVVSVRMFLSPNSNRCPSNNGSWLFPLILMIIVALWLGQRPTFGSGCFGDTVNYANEYVTLTPKFIEIDWAIEWLWQWIMSGCKAVNLTVNEFMTVIELGYFLSAFYAIKKYTPADVLLAVLFLMSSLMFYSFGVNGLRNGLACHIVMLGISFVFCGNYPVGIFLWIVAFGIHRSVVLPIISCICALTYIKDLRIGMLIWLISIVAALLMGDVWVELFCNIEFDQRMSMYASDNDYYLFSTVGFRWDFLLYSAIPIVLGWYVTEIRGVTDDWYKALLNIYCLSNAFWILVNTTAYSNRFAYLSWFLYPVLISYPLIMLPVWRRQKIVAGIALILYLGFTIIMNILWNNF